MTRARQNSPRDFLSGLAGRALGHDPAIRPRLPTLFETKPGEIDETAYSDVPRWTDTEPAPSPAPAPAPGPLDEALPARSIVHVDRAAPAIGDTEASSNQSHTAKPNSAPLPGREPLLPSPKHLRPAQRLSTLAPKISEPGEGSLSRAVDAQPLGAVALPHQNQEGRRGETERPSPSQAEPTPAAVPIGLTPVVAPPLDSVRAFARDSSERRPRRQVEAQGERVINVTIGRIEVRTAAPALPARPPLQPIRRELPQSLADYLKSRERGR